MTEGSCQSSANWISMCACENVVRQEGEGQIVARRNWRWPRPHTIQPCPNLESLKVK